LLKVLNEAIQELITFVDLAASNDKRELYIL